MKIKSAFVLILLVAVFTLGAGPAMAQGTIPAGGGTSTVPRPDSIGALGYGDYMANAPANVIAGGVLTGKVMVKGDPMLWEPITVMLTCVTGKAALTTDTDANGTFYINHVNLPKVYSTENDSLSNQMMQHYEGCSVAAPLAGYHSSSVTITQKNLRDNPYLSSIVLTPDEHAPGTAISTAGESASPDALKAFDKAHDEWLHRNFDDAQKDLQQAVQLNPQFAEAWYLLGRMQMRSEVEAASESFKKAVAADPKFEAPCLYLAAIAMEKKDWQGTNDWTSRGLALDPAGTALLWYYAAQADYHVGKNEAARVAAQTAMDMDPEHTVPNSEQLLALTLIDKGDYTDALIHLRNSLTYIPSGPSADLIKRQIAFVEQQNALKK
ncbi:MAG TPA: tetratricopeptide repeat protein [Acidobacteriaceae bacterium]|nr:tetratricopeptide repeat protein [Acidobacteriaceae bacterium]